MYSKSILSFVVLIILVTTTQMASAQPQPPNNGGGDGNTPTPAALALTIDGDWVNFSWLGTGSPFVSEGPFTFTASGMVKVKVTDLYCTGDRFRVFETNINQGDTTIPSSDPACRLYINNADISYADRYYSHGSFPLLAGSRSVTIQAIQNPFNSGAGAIRVASDNASGYVFLDKNRNGVKDGDETQGILTQLTMSRNGLNVDVDTSRNPDGFFQLWGGRRAGVYCIEISVPRGYHATTITEQCEVMTQGQAPFRKDFGVLPPVFLPMIWFDGGD